MIRQAGYFSVAAPKRRPFGARYLFKERMITQEEYLAALRKEYGEDNVKMLPGPFGMTLLNISYQEGPPDAEYAQRMSEFLNSLGKGKG